MMLVLFLVSCNVPGPAVPERVPEFVSALPGYLIVEYLDPDLVIGKLDWSGEPQVQPLLTHCERCSETSVSADGTKIAYLELSLEWDGGDDVWQLALGNTHPQPMIQDERPKRYPVWGPQGNHIAYVIQHDPYLPPDRPATDISQITPSSSENPVIIVYRHSTLHVYNLTDRVEVQLTPVTGYVLNFAWSPSGEQIVISARLEDMNEDGEVNFDDPARLYMVTLSDQTLTPFASLEASRAQMLKPSWSADGRYIAYVTNTSHLVIVSTTTGAEMARFEIGPGGDYYWSPNARQIAYIGFSTPEDSVLFFDDLFVFDLSTEKHTQITHTHTRTVYGSWELNGIKLRELVWSPDGQYVALAWETSGKTHLVVADVNTAQLTQITQLTQHHRLVSWKE